MQLRTKEGDSEENTNRGTTEEGTTEIGKKGPVKGCSKHEAEAVGAGESRQNRKERGSNKDDDDASKEGRR